jgi:hypothetical protein
MIEYRLVVGVLSILFKEDSALEANRQFDLFVIQSKKAESAENGTSVTLFKNDQIIAEYHPPKVTDSAKESADASE